LDKDGKSRINKGKKAPDMQLINFCGFGKRKKMQTRWTSKDARCRSANQGRRMRERGGRRRGDGGDGDGGRWWIGWW